MPRSADRRVPFWGVLAVTVLLDRVVTVISSLNGPSVPKGAPIARTLNAYVVPGSSPVMVADVPRVSRTLTPSWNTSYP